jgi:hypothetical protein
MKNPYLVRTAAVASLAAALLTAGYMGMQGDDMQIAPDSVALSSGSSAPLYHFPAGFEIKPGTEDSPVHEYY